MNLYIVNFLYLIFSTFILIIFNFLLVISIITINLNFYIIKIIILNLHYFYFIKNNDKPKQLVKVLKSNYNLLSPELTRPIIIGKENKVS